MTPTTTLRETIMVDTNALHLARLYLEYSRKHGIPPFGANAANPALLLDNQYAKKSPETNKHMKTGLKVVEYLRIKTGVGALLFYSPVTTIELICNQLKGKALLNALPDGPPSRWYSSMREEEILRRLNFMHYSNVSAQFRKLDNLFDDGLITISETTSSRSQETWVLAQYILQCVFLDLADCLIYSSAIVAEAAELITTDAYFKTIVNGLENPGASPLDLQPAFYRAAGKIKAAARASIGISPSPLGIPFTLPRAWFN